MNRWFSGGIVSGRATGVSVVDQRDEMAGAGGWRRWARPGRGGRRGRRAWTLPDFCRWRRQSRAFGDKTALIRSRRVAGFRRLVGCRGQYLETLEESPLGCGRRPGRPGRAARRRCRAGGRRCGRLGLVEAGERASPRNRPTTWSAALILAVSAAAAARQAEAAVDGDEQPLLDHRVFAAEQRLERRDEVADHIFRRVVQHRGQPPGDADLRRQRCRRSPRRQACAGRPRRHGRRRSGRSSGRRGPGRGRCPRSRCRAARGRGGRAGGRTACAARRGGRCPFSAWVTSGSALVQPAVSPIPGCSVSPYRRVRRPAERSPSREATR